MSETDLTAPQDLSPAALEERDQELAVQATADLGDDGLTLPMLKLTQQLSKSVAEGKLESGHYVNSLTDRDYGTELDLVIVYAAKGRFLSVRSTGKTYVAFGDVVPSNWPEKYVGKRFDELPDAEETYRELANEPGAEWGSGPPIQTTRNFVGFVTDEPDVPVRLSLKSTATPTAQKIGSLLRWRLKAPWHNTFHLSTRLDKDSQDNPYYVPVAELGDETSEDLREPARAMYQSIQANLANLRLTGEDAEAPAGAGAKPDGAGGLDVG